ncbi:MAG: hypothetical protein WC607_00305 [Candidatus Micrarchaeia archaeon]
MPITGDSCIAEYLQTHQYHPRSDAHGNELARLIVKDLMENCKVFREAALSKRIVFELNYTIGNGFDSWNMDLVVGPPENLNKIEKTDLNIFRGIPKEIWLAIDAKSIMTEHKKARRNRQRDLNSLQDLLHRKNSNTIVAGIVVVNMSKKFKSPLRNGEITLHPNVENTITETIEMLKQNLKQGNNENGLEALGVIVVDHTNLVDDQTKLIATPPAPSSSDRIFYKNFITELCTLFSDRHGQ